MHFHVVNVVMAISHDILSTAAPAARVGQHVIRAATVIRVRGRPPPSLPKFGNPRWLVKHLDTFWMAKFWDFGNIFGKNWKHTKSIISFCWFTTSTKQAQFCIVNAGTILAWSGLTDDWEIDSVCVFDLFRFKKKQWTLEEQTDMCLLRLKIMKHQQDSIGGVWATTTTTVFEWRDAWVPILIEVTTQLLNSSTQATSRHQIPPQVKNWGCLLLASLWS